MTISPNSKDLLARAGSVIEVLAIATDYLERLPLHHVALLPESCRPRPLATASDVNGYAYDLARYPAVSGSEQDLVIHKIANFMADCALRLAQLTARGAHPTEPGGGRRTARKRVA